MRFRICWKSVWARMAWSKRSGGGPRKGAEGERFGQIVSGLRSPKKTDWQGIAPGFLRIMGRDRTTRTGR